MKKNKRTESKNQSSLNKTNFKLKKNKTWQNARKTRKTKARPELQEGDKGKLPRTKQNEKQAHRTTDITTAWNE